MFACCGSGMQQCMVDEIYREAIALQVRNNNLLMDLKADCERGFETQPETPPQYWRVAQSPAATVRTGRVR